jgi:hypothetical protein
MPSYTRTVSKLTFISNDQNISGKDFRPDFSLVQIIATTTIMDTGDIKSLFLKKTQGVK